MQIQFTALERISLVNLLSSQRGEQNNALDTQADLLEKIQLPDEDLSKLTRNLPNGTQMVDLKAVADYPIGDFELEKAETREALAVMRSYKSFTPQDQINWARDLRKKLDSALA